MNSFLFMSKTGMKHWDKLKYHLKKVNFMRMIKEQPIGLQFVVATINETGAGYTPPFMELTKGTIYRVVSSGTDSGETILTLNSNGKEIAMYVNKRFRQPYKNEFKKVV